MKVLSVLLVCVATLFVVWGCSHEAKKDSIVEVEKRSCIDVTSYDRNWNNDMFCVSSEGRKKLTSYEGARILESL